MLRLRVQRSQAFGQLFSPSTNGLRTEVLPHRPAFAVMNCPRVVQLHGIFLELQNFAKATGITSTKRTL